ncbi:MAG: hypothetical protein E6L04_02515 [Thaumarchaeota archaeon]|nr:MAG: hypothetical protein E6L04_02515 [Nitrososphaerota archaeon]
MNIYTTVHELTRMLKEIRTYRASKPEYYSDMMIHLNNMAIRSFLEFTGSKVPKANLESIRDLLYLCRATTKGSVM